MTDGPDRLIPAALQTRAGWRDEFRAVTDRARREGDTRPAVTILCEWLEFRRQQERREPTQGRTP